MNNCDLGVFFSWWPSDNRSSSGPTAQPSPPSDGKSQSIINEKIAELKKLKAPDIRNLPIPITRDFSSFPFQQLELNAEDKADVTKSRCFKFQTSYYIAYVNHYLQDYIQPEHLDNPKDSIGMREARKNFWGIRSYKIDYELRVQYPYECSLIEEEYHKIDNQQIRDNRALYGDAFVDEIDRIEKKYKDRVWKRFGDFLQKNTGVVGIIALSAIGTTVFFYLPPASLLFFSAPLLL